MSADETSIRKKKSKVPDELIYELDEGKPIYYAGYKAVLNRKKSLEDIMGSSAFQTLVITSVLRYLFENLPPNYLPLVSELGFLIGKRSKRSLDLAIYNKAALPDTAFLYADKYVQMAPETVIEVDTKAEIPGQPPAHDYFHRKTDQLLEAGVQKVLWIFTKSRKWLFAEPGHNWIIGNWSDDIELYPSVRLNLENLVQSALK
jgi:hypothetical protein